MASIVPTVRPYLAHLPALAGYVLVIPINRKTGDIKALPRLCLPRRIHLNRSNHPDAMSVLTLAQDLGGDVAPIQQMFRRQYVFLR
jgi:hypothetical protein